MTVGKTGVERLVPVLMLLSVCCLLPGDLFSQADFKGRLSLDYLSTGFRGQTDERFDQDLELSVMDDLFVKNRMTLNYLLERYVATNQFDDIIRQRLRGSLVGRYYTFSGEFAPRYNLQRSTGASGQHVTGRRFNLVLTPPKAPATSLTYDWNRRSGGAGETRTNAINLDRFVNTSYAYKFTNYRALFRERKTDDRLSDSADRRIRDFNGGAGLNTSISSKVNLTADYDYLFTQDTGDTQFAGESIVNNLNGRASVSPVKWLMGFTSFLGNYIRRENDIVQRSSLSEVISGVRFTPFEFLRLSGTRDYRIIREDGEDESITDFARGEVVVQGRIRERMEGRVSVNRTFVIASKDGSFPSQGYLFSLNSELYPGVTMNSDFTITQSEDPGRLADRFQFRRAVDLRAIPMGKVMFDFNLRTLSYGREVPWFETQVLNYGIDINYQPTSQLATILTLSREEDRRVINRNDFLLNSTVNYTFRGGSSFSIIYNRRSAREDLAEVEDLEMVSFPGAEEGLFLQLSLKLKDRASVRLNFDTRKIPGGDRVENFGANFVKWF